MPSSSYRLHQSAIAMSSHSEETNVTHIQCNRLNIQYLNQQTAQIIIHNNLQLMSPMYFDLYKVIIIIPDGPLGSDIA